MPTSMMDALADEQIEITKLMAESSRLAIEALRRSTLLRRQLEKIADEDRRTSESAVLEISELREIASTHIPDAEIQGSPEAIPQARDSEEGNQGSGASASGDVDAVDNAEPEQAVAEAASMERDVEPRDEVEAAPDDYTQRLNATLDLYAQPGIGVYGIASKLGITAATVEAHIRSGRASGDKRAARGDELRDIGNPIEQARPKRKFAQPFPAAASGVAAVAAEDEKPASEKPLGDLLILDLKDCRATYADHTIQLVRRELRLLHLLNSQVPVSGIQVLNHCSILSTKLLRRDLGKLNPRLAQIGITVAELVGNFFQLQTIEAAL